MSEKVTFLLSSHIVAEASEGLLLGDFNDWNRDNGIPLSRNEDGSLSITIELEPGQAYQYRYLLNDGRWENDDTAQYYVSAEGLYVENCVVVIPAKETTEVAVGAKKTAATKKVKAPAKKAAARKTAEKHDLVKIEGIGKQIAALLHKNGILTYSQLAKASIKKLKEILAAGGAKFNAHDPSGWSKQSKLAAAGKWEELEALQKTLVAGK